MSTYKYLHTSQKMGESRLSAIIWKEPPLCARPMRRPLMRRNRESWPAWPMTSGNIPGLFNAASTVGQRWITPPQELSSV